MQLPTTMKAFKKEAKELTNTKKIKYMKALDEIAVKYGFKNWNIAKGKLAPEKEGITEGSELEGKILFKINTLLMEIQDEQTQIGNYIKDNSSKGVSASNACLSMIIEKEYNVEFLNSLLANPLNLDISTKDKVKFFEDMHTPTPVDKGTELTEIMRNVLKDQKKIDSRLYIAEKFSDQEERKRSDGVCTKEDKTLQEKIASRKHIVEMSTKHTHSEWEYTLTMKGGDENDFTHPNKKKVISMFEAVADKGEWSQLYKKEWLFTPGQEGMQEGEVIILDNNTYKDAEYWVWGCIDGKDVETLGMSFEKAEWASEFRDALLADRSKLAEFTERDVEEFTSIETRYQRK